MKVWNKTEILGRMNERIAIESVSETRSASGAISESWSTFATVWAAISYQKVGTDEKEMVAKQKKYFRFVNNNDVVPRVPLRSTGYADAGYFLYFDKKGVLLLDRSSFCLCDCIINRKTCC